MDGNDKKPFELRLMTLQELDDLLAAESSGDKKADDVLDARLAKTPDSDEILDEFTFILGSVDDPQEEEEADEEEPLEEARISGVTPMPEPEDEEEDE
ncbi:MAG: hypothetical protein IKU73_02170, partial [Clostridia bacterium]|nr:hypothetical protein [Clostridia bacterium]